MITYNWPSLQFSKKAFIPLCMLLSIVTYGQSFDELYAQIQMHDGQPQKQLTYLQAFLDKAKWEKNTDETINAYRNFMHTAQGNIAIAYGDSMVNAAIHSGDSLLLSGAFLSRGIYFYGKKKYSQALENYIMANQFIGEKDDPYLKNKIHYNIAQIKYYLGDYVVAIELLEGCISYFRNLNDRAYLNSLHSMALCFNRMGDYGRSTKIAQSGIDESKRISSATMESYFKHVEGINQYFLNNYGTALGLLTGSIPAITENDDFANEAVGYYYLGKTYLGLGDESKAIEYFRKVDEIFNTHQYIREDLRGAYLYLAEYYKSRGNYASQLYQLNQLLKADSILKDNYKKLSHKLYLEYDTREIRKERETVIKQLEKSKKVKYRLYLIVLFLILFILIFIYRHFRLKKQYKKRFDALMNKEKKSNVRTEGSFPEINDEAVKTLLVKLEKFEKNQKFLEKDWTLFKLAANFNSNTKYLSQVIHVHRNVSFPEYINNLKVNYIIELLKTDRKIRKYTHKALAEDAGFSSTQRFTNAFKSFTGISPCYFIQELEKEEGKS